MKKTMMQIGAAVAAVFIVVKQAQAAGPLSSIDDVRVAPLMTTHWAQGDAGNKHCYNYYTPLNRVCGCTATAIGQIMYYHRYPTERILPGETLYDTIDGFGRYEVGTDGNGGMTNTTTGAYTAFDPPYGGPYRWSDMVDSPDGHTESEAARSAIGQLTRDAGFAEFSHYFVGETSGYTAAIASGLILNLHYADAVRTGFNANKLIANLDAGLPVQVGLTDHAVVADGYGYHDGKLYIHINFGYGGTKDGWYDTTTQVQDKNIQDMVANIFPPTRGARHSSVISGRILDANGNPVANASVTATDLSSYAVVSTNSNAKGIYAFILPAGNYAFVAESGNAIGNGGYTVLASSQKTRAEGDGWGSGENNSASGVDIVVSNDVDYGKCWRNNAGDGLFSNPQNWSDNTLPASGEDVTVIATSETLITSASDMTVGTVSVPFGVARFGGSGVITVGGVNVSFDASLATGGALRFSSLAIPSGAVVEITGAEGLADAGITGAGTLVINPGAGNTLTMTKNNTGFTGPAVIKSGTVKFGASRSFGAQPSNIRVKGGATLDENNVTQGGYSGQKNYLTLEEGATLAASSGNVTTGSPLTKMTLEGNATVDATSGTVSIADGYDYLKMEINLGTNTLTKIGPKDFYISCCEISGTGLFDVTEGRVVMAPMWFTDNSPSSCSEGTMRIRSGASVYVRDNNNKVMILTVKDLILDGSVTKGTCNHVLKVTGSITGSGTTQMLTLKPGAVFKPTGTGFLTITESLSGTLRLDLAGLDLSSTNEVPLVKVPSSLVSSVILDAADIPQGWGVHRIEEGGKSCFLLKEGCVEEEIFHTHLLGRFAMRAEDFDVGDYVQTGLIAHYDGIRNAGAGADHDPTTRTWANLVSGGPDATFVGDGGEWNVAGNGFVFDGSTVRAEMDSPGVDMNHVNSTVQIACDVDYTQQSSGGDWYPGIFVRTDQDYGIFYNNTGSKSNTLNYKPWPYSNNDGGQRPSISPWGGKYVTAAFDGYKQYLVEGTLLGEGKNRSSYSAQGAKRFAWGGNPQGSTRYVKGTYHSVRIYNVTLSDDELYWNRIVDEARFRDGSFSSIGGCDIVIASNIHGRDGAEPCGNYIVNGSHTFSAASQMVNGRLWELNGYTLEKWDYDTGSWASAITNSEASAFAYTNSVLNGRMRLTWLWTVAKPVWTNADGTGSLESASNWNFIPEPGEDVTMNLSGDTSFTAVEAKSYGTMTINGGYSVDFSNAATVTLLDGIALNGVTNLVTGGKLRVSAIDVASGVVVEITGAEGLDHTGITGAGTLVINPGTGNTITMTKNNTGFTGEAVIKSGIVKFGDSRSFGAQPSKIRVKGGATLDENNVSQGGYSGQKNYLTLEDGATLTASSGDVTTGSPLTKMTLEGDATIDATSGTVSIADGYDYLKMEINLGTNTLTKIGSKDFYISCCAISGTGLFDVTEGRIVMAPMYFTDNSPSSCSEGTMRIRSGASIYVRDNNNKVMVLTVKDLILDGSVSRATCNHVLAVTGSITGSGTTQMLTMKPGAVFKPSGTGYLTITDSLSGVLKLDVSDPSLKNASKIPLVKVPSALAGSVSFDNLPKSHELKIDEADGTVEYWLKHRGFSIILR